MAAFSLCLHVTERGSSLSSSSCRPLIPWWGSTLTASSNPVLPNTSTPEDHHIGVCGFSMIWVWETNLMVHNIAIVLPLEFFKEHFGKSSYYCLLPFITIHVPTTLHSLASVLLWWLKSLRSTGDLSVTSGVYSSVLILDLSWVVRCWWSFISSWFPPLVSENDAVLCLLSLEFLLLSLLPVPFLRDSRCRVPSLVFFPSQSVHSPSAYFHVLITASVLWAVSWGPLCHDAKGVHCPCQATYITFLVN